MATKLERSRLSIYAPKQIRDRLDEVHRRFQLKALRKRYNHYYSLLSLNNVTTVTLVVGIDRMEKMTLKQFTQTLNAIHNGH